MKKYVLLVVITFCSLIVFSQNVGINTETPQAVLDVNGDVIFKTSDLAVADGINIALDINTTRFSYYRLSGPTADFTVAGITAGNDGRLLTLFNRTGFTMQLNNEDVNAAVTDMIVTGTAADITIPNKGIVNLQYDATEEKWIVKSSSKGTAAGGGGFWDASGNNIFNINTGNVGLGTNLPGTKLTIQTSYNSQGWKHVGINGVDSIVLSEAIGGVSAAIGTSTNHTMRFNSNGLGRMHIYPNGNVTVGDNNAPANDKFTVQSDGFGLTHTNLLGSITLGSWIGSFGGATGGWLGTKSNDPLNLFTNNGGASLSIVQNGNVGIGASNPAFKLDVAGRMRLRTQADGNSAGLWLNNPSNTNAIAFLGIADAVTTGFFGNVSGWGLVMNTNTGFVGIGTLNPTSRLSVNGSIRSKEVVVETGWADYVFDKKYKLKTLDEVEKFIEENNHLPGIPSAAEIEKNGLQLGDTQKKMMEKIEELTLYVIALKKEIDTIKNIKK